MADEDLPQYDSDSDKVRGRVSTFVRERTSPLFGRAVGCERRAGSPGKGRNGPQSGANPGELRLKPFAMHRRRRHPPLAGSRLPATSRPLRLLSVTSS
jgi:hypothetical protein